MGPLNLGRSESDNPQLRMLRGVHDTFARALAASLSAFLQSEISAEVEAISSVSAADFRQSILAPACVISFQLHPRPEGAVLSLDCSTAFSLLELLLGGKSGLPSGTQSRSLTEIEWTLFEEITRILVASLGDGWKTFHPVEFNVQSLESDPDLLPLPDPTLQLFQIAFTVQVGEQKGGFQIGVPQTFFEVAAESSQKLALEPPVEEVQRNLSLLAEARVDLEVLLDGPTMEIREIAGLSVGQVVRFDYPLLKPLRALVNGTTPISCQIVTAGRKRALQVEELP